MVLREVGSYIIDTCITPVKGVLFYPGVKRFLVFIACAIISISVRGNIYLLGCFSTTDMAWFGVGGIPLPRCLLSEFLVLILWYM